MNIEAHDIIMAADYHHSFKKLMKLTDFNVQIVLLTATLSSHSEVVLLEVRYLSAHLMILNVFVVIENISLISMQNLYTHSLHQNSVPYYPHHRKHYQQQYFVHGSIILSPKSQERYHLYAHHSLLQLTG